MKTQKHDLTHVEIWLGDGPKTIGARWQKGKVQVFDSYQFNATSYHSPVYIFKSIDTWLMGICRRSHMLAQLLLTTPSYVTVINAVVAIVVTFCVSRRRRKMYCGHARLCVCLSVRGRTRTLLHGPGCNLGAW